MNTFVKGIVTNDNIEMMKNVINESKQSVTKATIEDDLHWARVRIEELLDELKQASNKIEEEQKKNQVLVDCLSNEHTERKNAFKEIEYAYKRVDKYRSAICEIAEISRKILKGIEDKSTKPTVEELAKQIFDITNKF